MQSGIFAARAMFAALRQGDTSAAALAPYDRLVGESFIMGDLYRTRNLRLAFKHGFYRGGLLAGLMTLTGGRWPRGRIALPPDAEIPRPPPHPAGAAVSPNPPAWRRRATPRSLAPFGPPRFEAGHLTKLFGRTTSLARTM